jgi:spore coat polysaccharide biosynthesis protein SpsF
VNILTVIQARIASTRLPGKVMLPLNGKPLLIRVYERIISAELPGTVIVATSTDRNDDPIESLCQSEGLEVFRGHSTDLLDRHYRAGLKYDAEALVKIPSDCPLISPSVIRKVISYYLENNKSYDYVSNLHPATYPDGNDVEVMKFSSLETAWKYAVRDFEREHTTPFLWENKGRFNIGNVEWEKGLNYSMTHRFTIDYPEDYEFIRKVYEYFGSSRFELEDILLLLEQKPELAEINQKYNGVNWYRHHLNDLTTITPGETRKTEDEKK